MCVRVRGIHYADILFLRFHVDICVDLLSVRYCAREMTVS